MANDKEHSGVLAYALVFFLLLTVVSYLLMRLNLENQDRLINRIPNQLVSPAVLDINNIFK